MEHTTGPWKTDKNGIITGGPHYCTSVATTPVILWYTGDAGKGRQHQMKNINEARANARLIAAAPELLEACKSAQKALLDNAARGSREDAWIKLEKAIKSAKGGK